jgi:hypothetical protein
VTLAESGGKFFDFVKDGLITRFFCSPDFGTIPGIIRLRGPETEKGISE